MKAIVLTLFVAVGITMLLFATGGVRSDVAVSPKTEIVGTKQEVRSPVPVSTISNPVTTREDFNFEWQVETLRELFAEDYYGVVGKANEVLCADYTRVLDLRDALFSATDAHWKASGVEKPKAEKVFRNAVDVFIWDVEELIFLSKGEAKKLDYTEDACGGMFRPGEPENLVNILTSTLRESEVERPKVSARLNAHLLATYKKMLKGEGGKENLGDALYWFTPAELGVTLEKITT
ncbi:MAG: hypothetical protein WAV15_04585 [Minisyncoccia bacterium]